MHSMTRKKNTKALAANDRSPAAPIIMQTICDVGGDHTPYSRRGHVHPYARLGGQVRAALRKS